MQSLFQIKDKLSIIVAEIIRKFVLTNISAFVKLVRNGQWVGMNMRILKKALWLPIVWKKKKKNIFVLLITCNAPEHNWHRNILEAYYLEVAKYY